MLRTKIAALAHKIVMIDWTEKCFANVMSNIDAKILSEELKDKKQNVMNESKEVDISDCDDVDSETEDADSETSFDDEIYYDTEDEKTDYEHYDYGQKLKKSKKLKLSFQVITSEWNYILDHSLVPKG